jgi:hypothetical protein
MRRITTVFAMILFMVSFVAGVALSTSPASAQIGPGSRVLANGQVLTWSDFYELDQTTVAVVDGVEFVDLYSATGWFSVITTNFPAYGNVLRDLSVQDLQATVPLRQIDRGDYDNVSYSLDTTIYQGVDIGAFTLVLDQGSYAQLTMVVAPVTTFQYELQIAQAELTIGGGGVFQGVDPVKMQNILTGATGVPLMDLNATTTTQTVVVPANQATTAQTTNPPANTTTTTQTTNPPANTTTTTQTTNVPVTTSSVMVGSTQVGWSGPWVQETGLSTPTQVAFSQVDQAAGTVEMVSYGEFATGSVTLDSYAQTFFQGAGATNVQQTDGGVLANGAEWRVYRFSLQGTDMGTFVMGKPTTTGSYAITMVTGNAPLMMFTLIDVQTQFSLNGSASLLDGVDPILASISLL